MGPQHYRFMSEYKACLSKLVSAQDNLQFEMTDKVDVVDDVTTDAVKGVTHASGLHRAGARASPRENFPGLNPSLTV